MANNVFANGNEISCKSGDGKSICAFPDVCMTPPENPATPPGVPVPYPNTGMASDTTSGSKTVKITGKEVMLKNKSHFKKSLGDEAGSAAKKGVITSVNRGKVYFAAWSMDVKVEGENAVRHMDMTTHNHGSGTNAAPTIHVDRMSLISQMKGCRKEKKAIQDACGKSDDPKKLDPKKTKCPGSKRLDDARALRDSLPNPSAARKAAQVKVDMAVREYSNRVTKNDCQRALRCALVSYNAGSRKKKKPSDKEAACCPPQTPEHLVPASMFGAGRGSGNPNYSAGKAACMCAEGGATRATHGLLGRGRHKYLTKTLGVKDTSSETTEKITAKQAIRCGAHSASKVTPQCGRACLEEQLKKSHEKVIDEDVRPVQNEDGKNIPPQWEATRSQTLNSLTG